MAVDLKRWVNVMEKYNRIIEVKKITKPDANGHMSVFYNLTVANNSGESVMWINSVPQDRIDGTPAVGRRLQKMPGPLWLADSCLWRIHGNWFYNMAHNLKRRFDYTPVDVQKPEPDFFVYAPQQKRFLGYKVVVTYKNNQRKTFFFSHDMDHFALFNSQYAYDRAMDFYNKKCKQMQSKSK